MLECQTLFLKIGVFYFFRAWAVLRSLAQARPAGCGQRRQAYPYYIHSGLFASARATGPHREFNKYLGAPKTQPDVELRRGSGSIEIKQILSATSRETLFSGTACPGLVIAPVYYCRRLLSPTSDTHIGLLSPPFSASATSWRLLGHQQARLQIRVRFWP